MTGQLRPYIEQALSVAAARRSEARAQAAALQALADQERARHSGDPERAQGKHGL